MNQILDTLRKNLGVSDFELTPGEVYELNSCLEIKSQALPERVARLLFESTTSKLPLSLRFRLTSLMKKIRNPKNKIAVKRFHELVGVKIVQRILQKKSPQYFYGDYQGAICLTHDVDNLNGWRHLEKTSRLNAKYGLPATFNFLTRADYKLEKDVLNTLQNLGFEIGLHGLTHDIALAFRSKNKIRQHLEQGLADLELRNIGFRSPAFSISRALLESLSESGFIYDSSIQTASTFYHSSEFHFPYLIDGTKIVEIPLTINDDIFFRDAQLSSLKTLEIISETLENVTNLGGVCVLNIHPHNLPGHWQLYEDILRLIVEKKQALLTTTGKIAKVYLSTLNSS